jgi:hypothetical protein
MPLLPETVDAKFESLAFYIVFALFALFCQFKICKQNFVCFIEFFISILFCIILADKLKETEISKTCEI